MVSEQCQTDRKQYEAANNIGDQLLRRQSSSKLCALLRAALRNGAHEASRLSVHVASHTPLAKELKRPTLGGTEQRSAQKFHSGVRLLSGIDGAPVFSIEHGIRKLAIQVSTTVHWNACMAACLSANATKVIELGPGNGLIGMMRHNASGVSMHAASEFQSIAGLRAWLKE